MANVIKYYYDFLSQPSRAMYIIMKLSETPFKKNPIALKLGEQFTDEYKEINRFQRVPCIVHNNIKLSESIAILRYLHRCGYITDTLYPSDLIKQARVDEYLEWQHLNTRLNGFLYFQHKWLRKQLTGEDPIPKKLNSLELHLNKAMDSIEKIWLHSNSFIVSEQLTAADIFAACEIEQPRIAGFDPFENRPKLKAWLETVRKVTNPYYDEAHQICNELREGKHALKL